MVAADRLVVPDLMAATQRDAAALLSADNIVALANFAASEVPATQVLQEATFAYMRAHFEHLRTRPDLCRDLALSVFLSLIACPSLCVRDEGALLDAVWRRLSHGGLAKGDVVSLLGHVRLDMLNADSLAALSTIADGGTAGPVEETYEALQQGVTAVVLGGLTSFANGAVCGPQAPVRSVQRCDMVGRTGMVLFHPRSDKSARVSSSEVDAIGHKWLLQVYRRADSKKINPGDLEAFVHITSEATSAVTTRTTIWALCVDGCSYFPSGKHVVRRRSECFCVAVQTTFFAVASRSAALARSVLT